MRVENGRAGLAVVTGASSGIGAALARELSGRGRPVLAVARRGERLDALAAAAAAAGRAPVHPLALDVAAPDAAARVRERARELGGAAWLVNNAGFGMYGPFRAQPAARITEMIRLNCEALVALTGALVPDLVEAGRGAVVNVASVAGFQPTPYMAAYGATKAFVLSFSEALSEELAGTGVTVTAFCPGPVATEFGAVAGYVHRRGTPPGQISAEAAARAAVDAAEAGEVVAVPGPLNRIAVLTGKLLPRAWVRRASRQVLRPAGGPT
jgi:short-subunit dehydrogenase